MTTEQGQLLAPPAASSVRPTWVTDELIRRWCGWVGRDAAEAGDAPESTTAIAPYDLSPIAAVPACTPQDVRAVAATARAAQPQWADTSIADRGKVVLAFH